MWHQLFFNFMKLRGYFLWEKNRKITKIYKMNLLKSPWHHFGEYHICVNNIRTWIRCLCFDSNIKMLRHLTTKHKSLQPKLLEFFSAKTTGARGQKSLLQKAVTVNERAFWASFIISLSLSLCIYIYIYIYISETHTHSQCSLNGICFQKWFVPS